MDDVESVKQIGRSVAEYRSRRGQVLTQDKLAEVLALTRTKIAHLEEGRELPAPEELTRICRHLEIPESLWLIGTHPFYLKAMQFESLLSELIGRRADHTSLEGIDQVQAVRRIQTLFDGHLSEIQSHAQFNSIMVVYGERPVTRDFFTHYLGVEAFRDISALTDKVRLFQSDSMRLYGNFRRAWTRLSRITPLSRELEPLQAVLLQQYESRTPFESIKEIAPDRLPQLGYIAVNRIKEQNRERSELAKYLAELAKVVEEKGTDGALNDLQDKRRRRIQTLLRQFEIDGIELEHGLFSHIDAESLRAEAQRIVPEQNDLIQIDETQKQGLQNLAAYLTEPYLDVYVATSMRDDADFLSVNAFAKQLFQEDEVRKLHLRFFNPTQSWIGDRVSKGLVEALMLRRSRVTVYMAQKGDTFGKDSEASVALGQGKTVIVYVPRLYDRDAQIDSERLFQMTDKLLDQELVRLKIDVEEGVDQKAKARLVLQAQLRSISDDIMKRIVYNHWADFDLHGELVKIASENLRKTCSAFVKAVRISASGVEVDGPDATVKSEIADRLVATAEAFESRARTFRDVHPLSLQVIVRSGVVNGILVTRSVQSCARVLRGVIENTLKTKVVTEPDNYRLVEQETQSTLRVVSRHQLLTNAFWTQYFENSGRTVDDELLEAKTI
jgi:transcriptional regulator with XRE-family HTH domain